MNRFLTYLGKGQEEMGRAAKKLVGFLSCCIEQDYLGTSKLTQLLCEGNTLKPTKFEGDPGSSTSSKRPCAVADAIAKAALNQLAVATLTLLDPDSSSRERCLQVVGKPLLTWYGEMSRSVRSVDTSFEWLRDQLTSGLFDHLVTIIKTLTTPAAQAVMGFKTGMQIKDGHAFDIQCSEEDHMAKQLALLSTHLVSFRLQRCLWMLLGWSWRSILWTSPDKDLAMHELARFAEHLELDKEAAMQQHQPGVAFLRQASQFQAGLCGAAGCSCGGGGCHR